MVEFALILPIFALLLVIAIDFGRVYFSYIEVTNAAREAAAFGANSPTDSQGIEDAAKQEVNVQGQDGEGGLTVATACKNSVGTAIACSAATNGTGPGNTLTVTVSEPFSFITPLVNNFLGDFTMRTSATSTVLGYAASSGGGGGGGTTCLPPVPSFTVVVISGLTIHVDPTASTPNSGICTISGYNWTWGDGNDGVGSAYGDDYTYLSAGTYTITLETTNQGGAVTTSHPITVPVGPPAPTCTKPTASFTVVENGNTHTYTDTSTVVDPTNCPITAWYWTFGDGTHSNVQFPLPHDYSNSGKHTVTLTVTNTAGSDTASNKH